jgi:hypothetical protein
MTNEVINYDKTRQQIAEAQAVDEVLDIRAKMEALVKLFSAKRDPEQERRARELQLLAEARIGEMSLTLKRCGGRPTENNSRPGGENNPTKKQALKSSGLSTEQASRFERLAEIPKAELAQAARNGKSARSVLKASTKPNSSKIPEDQQQAFIKGVFDDGRAPLEVLSEMFGRPVKNFSRGWATIRGEESGRRAALSEIGRQGARAEAPIPIDTFSMSVQERIEAWKRQQLKTMEDEFESRVSAECRRQMSETFLPYYKEKEALYERIVKTRKGMMTRAIYNKIRSCLHPDRVQDVGQKKLYEETFRLFNDLELIFLDEKERPTSAFRMPTTVAEMMAMRKGKGAPGRRPTEAT